MKERIIGTILTIAALGAVSDRITRGGNGPTDPGSSVNIERMDPDTRFIFISLQEALLCMQQSENPKIKRAASKFSSLSQESKISYISSGLVAHSILSVTTSRVNGDAIALIGLSRESMLKSSLTKEEVARKIFEVTYIYDQIEDNPRLYEDQNLHQKLNERAKVASRQVFCQE